LTGLLGAGLGHSLSPQLHSAAYAAAGVPRGEYHYQLIDLKRTGVDHKDPAALASVLRGLADVGFAGVNVTIPCKVDVVHLLDHVEASAVAVGAVNVVEVCRTAAPRARLIGHNTDCLGVQRALAEVGVLPHRGSRVSEVVAILGAGGIARAVLASLCELGGVAEVRIFDSDAPRAAELAAEFAGPSFAVVAASSALQAAEGAAGLVNASPVGMAGFPVSSHGSMEEFICLKSLRWLADMVYNPSETPLVKRARSLGLKVVSGDRVFLHQGAAAFEIMNPGLRADLAVMESTLSGLLVGATHIGKGPSTPEQVAPAFGMGCIAGVGKPVSRLVFGTARLGGTKDPLELLDTVWAAGVNTFDLARSYGGGQSEFILGSWLKSRSIPRSSVRLITKGGVGSEGSTWVASFEEDVLDEELKTSLSALGVPYVDCYMLHRDNEGEDVGRVVRYLCGLVTRGFALSYGFSNWRYERVVAAAVYADTHGLPAPAAVGPQFSLAQPARPVWPGSTFLRNAKEIEWYVSRGIAVMCWEVLGKGLLANPAQWSTEEASAPAEADVEELEAKSGGGKDLEKGDAFRDFRIRGAYITRENFARRKQALALAEARGVPLAQVAVAYVLAQAPQFFAILGPRSATHFVECLPSIELSPRETEALKGVGLPEGGAEQPAKRPKI